MVADDITMQPAALTRASSDCSGRPKWKLTISGLDQLAHCGIERHAIGRIDRRRRIYSMLLIIGRQPAPPSGLAGGIGIDGLVAEEIQVDWRRDALPDDVDLLARLLHRQQRAGHRGKTPTLCDRDGKLGVHRAGHRCERDRKFGLEEIQDTTIGPHGLIFRLRGIRAGVVAATDNSIPRGSRAMQGTRPFPAARNYPPHFPRAFSSEACPRT
jgi:hypothetical protein